MTEAFERIKKGLLEAIDYMQGKPGKAIVHRVQTIDVKAIREKLGMSQSDFSATCGVSVSTVRRWEKGEIMPSGPARALFTLADKEPQAVRRAFYLAKPTKPPSDALY